MSLAVNALFRRYADETATYDYDEASARREKEAFDRDAKLNKTEDLRQSGANFASRGMAHAGARIKQDTDLRRSYERAGADADAQFNSFITNLAKKRLASEQQYKQDKSVLDIQNLIGGTSV